MSETTAAIKYTLIVHESWGSETYYNIVAARDIPVHGVRKGDIGGVVNGMHNLSQKGDCWVDKTSSVLNKAFVFGNALIKNSSKVIGNSYVGGDAILDSSDAYDNARVIGRNVLRHCDIEGHIYLVDLCDEFLNRNFNGRCKVLTKD